MHSSNATEGTRFVHNGDFSGNVRIGRQLSGGGYGELEVPFNDLREFVLGAMRDKVIERLENADGGELEEMFLAAMSVSGLCES